MRRGMPPATPGRRRHPCGDLVTVEIRRSGGFAGIEEKLASLDTNMLPKAAADELLALVARLSAWCARQRESIGADRISYQVGIVEPRAGSRTLTVIDEGDPDDPAMKLVRAILDLAGARQ